MVVKAFCKCCDQELLIEVDESELAENGEYVGEDIECPRCLATNRVRIFCEVIITGL